MKKFIMILSALIMMGSAFVGISNKDDLKRVVESLERLRVEVKTATAQLGEAEDKRDDATEKETQSKDSRNQAAAVVEGVKQELKIAARAVEDVSSELRKVEIEKKEIDLAVKRQFPDGKVKSIDDLTINLTMLKDTLTEKQNKTSELTAAVTTAQQAKQSEASKVKQEEKYQMQRAQKLALNGLTATVIAANKEWGFVMVNAGRQHGVSPDASLLVKRGNTRIARLRIVTLEDAVTVADVVDESIVPGIEVHPGDKVIFENVQ